MARTVSGSLYIPECTATEVPGVYQVLGAAYSSVLDSGNGVYDLAPNYLVYIIMTDINSGMVLSGYANRFKIISIDNIIDQYTLDITIQYDDIDEDIYNPMMVPSSGLYSIVSSSNYNEYGSIPSCQTYSELPIGIDISAILRDRLVRNSHLAGTGGGSSTSFEYITVTPLISWTINHNKNSRNFTYTIFDDEGYQVLPNDIKIIDDNNIEIIYIGAMAGKAHLVFN